MRLAALLILLAAPVHAQDAPVLDPAVRAAPGAVALYLQAQGLAELGQRRKDPLMVATAARLLHGLRLTATARQPEPERQPLPLVAPEAAALLEVARKLDASRSHADLIDLLAREVPPAPRALRATASRLAPGQSEMWTLSFYGGTSSELAIIGDGSSNLDLVVTAGGDSQICVDLGNGDRAYCGFALRENGDVTVTVSNAGAAAGGYILLTD